MSFTGAARELGLTQSAVSQQIKGLEGYLEIPLFYRKTRVLELTEAGRGYLPTVQEAFATLSSGTRNLMGPDREQVLKVQSNLGFSTFWLAPRLPKLFGLHLWLKLNIFTAIWGPEKTAATADVEIRLGVTPGKDVKAEKLQQEKYFPVCAADMDVSEEDIPNNYLYDCRGLNGTWDNRGGGVRFAFCEFQCIRYRL